MSRIWIALGIVAIMVLRRFSPIAGSSLAIIFAFVIAGWGTWVYNQNGGVGLVFMNTTLPQQAFYGIIAVWCGLEIWGLIRNIRNRPETPAEE